MTDSMLPEELMIVRTDNGTGTETLCTWDRAEKMIRDVYSEPECTLRDLSMGHSIRCTFATYRKLSHRFVEGFQLHFYSGDRKDSTHGKGQKDN